MNHIKKINELELKILAAKRQKAAIESRTDFLKFTKFTMPDPDDFNNTDMSLFKDYFPIATTASLDFPQLTFLSFHQYRHPRRLLNYELNIQFYDR